MPSIKQLLGGLGQVVEVSALQTKHLDYLMAPNRRLEAETEFLKSIVPMCAGISAHEFKDYYVYDMSAIIVAMYRATFGNKLVYKSKCPDCQRPSEITVEDLSQAPLRLLKTDAKGANPEGQDRGFTYSSPQGQGLTWRYLKVRDLLQVNEDVARNEKNTKGEMGFKIAFTLAAHLESVDSIKTVDEKGMPLPEPEIRKLFQKWAMETGMDFTVDFQDELDKRAFGLDLDVSVKCGGCQEEYVDTPDVMGSFFKRKKKGVTKAISAQVVRYSGTSTTSSSMNPSALV